MPIKYLYYDMLKPPSLDVLDEDGDSDGNMIISDSKLRELLPPQVQIMSNQRRDFFGREIFILAG